MKKIIDTIPYILLQDVVVLNVHYNTVYTFLGLSRILRGLCTRLKIKISPHFKEFGPDHAEKRRRMEPNRHLYHFDNEPQDGDTAGVAEAGRSRCHPAPNARPRHSPVFAISNPTTKEEGDPGWSITETSNKRRV